MCGGSSPSASCCASAPVMVGMVSMSLNPDQCFRQAVRSSERGPSMTCQQVVMERSVHDADLLDKAAALGGEVGVDGLRGAWFSMIGC